LRWHPPVFWPHSTLPVSFHGTLFKVLPYIKFCCEKSWMEKWHQNHYNSKIPKEVEFSALYTQKTMVFLFWLDPGPFVTSNQEAFNNTNRAAHKKVKPVLGKLVSWSTCEKWVSSLNSMVIHNLTLSFENFFQMYVCTYSFLSWQIHHLNFLC
jgi:hypothetical protein